VIVEIPFFWAPDETRHVCDSSGGTYLMAIQALGFGVNCWRNLKEQQRRLKETRPKYQRGSGGAYAIAGISPIPGSHGLSIPSIEESMRAPASTQRMMIQKLKVRQLPWFKSISISNYSESPQ